MLTLCKFIVYSQTIKILSVTRKYNVNNAWKNDWIIGVIKSFRRASVTFSDW